MSKTISRFNRDTFSVFRILPWTYLAEARSLTMHYALDDVHQFSEVVTLPDSLAVGSSDEVASGVVDLLCVVAGVSYFKIAAPRTIAVEFPLTSAAQTMAAHVYDDGLRELAYRNGLAVPLLTALSVGTVSPSSPNSGDHEASREVAKSRPLVPMGGGRDSALLSSILAPFDPILTVHGENRFIDRLGDVLGRTIHQVRRTIDPRLLELNDGPALNGHVPVTAINSLIGALTASLVGATDVVMANERSASAASLTTADGYSVNHQYSKSFEFELLLAEALASVGGPRYFSGLRPWSELAISRAFAARPALHRAIMSCNRAFLRDPATRSNGWCGHCDKCRFVFLTLAPFIPRPDLVDIFGRDLLADESNAAGFAALLSDDTRPWDCVGEPSEARLAFDMISSLSARSARSARSAALDEALSPSSEHRIPVVYQSVILEAMTS